MNLKKIAFGILIPISMLLNSFTPPKVDTYKINETTSKLTWIGRKVTGEHHGNILLNSGTLNIEGKSIKGGTFEIKMRSITNEDIKDKESNAKLVKHLNSDDFFATEKHPTSTLVITNVSPKGKDMYEVTGNLTIKNITNEVKFPATIAIKGNNLVANAKIVVDRTKFDIKYKSTSFFESLGDKAIHDNFDLKVEIRASKQ